MTKVLLKIIPFRLLSTLAAFWTAAGLLLAACGPAPTPVEPAEIVFYAESADKSYYQTLIKKFNQEYPEISVTLKTGPYLRSEDGQPGWDVRIITWNSRFQRRSEQMDVGLDLNSLISQDVGFNRDDYYPGTLEAFIEEGELRALPIGIDPWVMFYNKDLFDQNGTAYPQPGWTWDDFLSAARALTDQDAGVFGYVPAEFTLDSLLFVQQHGGRLSDENGAPTFDDPAAVEAMQWYSNLFYVDKVAPNREKCWDVFDMASAEQLGPLLGKVGMWMGPLLLWRGIPDTSGWKFRLGVAALPRDVNAFTLATFDGIAISSQTRHPEASWRWVSFLADEMPRSSMPVRISLAESKAYESYAGSEVALAAREAMKDAALPGPTSEAVFNYTYNLIQVAQNIYDGNPDAAALMEATQRRLESQ